jgi:hypothetical protein
LSNVDIEKFTSILNSRRLCKSAILPIFHMLYLDGVYAEDNYGKTRLDVKHPCFSSKRATFGCPACLSGINSNSSAGPQGELHGCV